MTLRICALWFGIDRLLTLNMPAEAEAHRREYFLAKGVLLSRSEAGEECGSNHIRRDRFLDRSLDRPATFTQILNEAGKILQLRVLC